MRSTICVLIFGGLLWAGADDSPSGKGREPRICEVHDVAMEERVLPYRHGMIPMHKSMDRDGEWALRRKRFPHPGDCIPATDIVLPGQEGSGVDDVCPVCVAARKAHAAAAPDAAAPKTDKASAGSELVRLAARELARLDDEARGDRGTESPPPAAQVAYCLLAGLAEQGTPLEAITPEDRTSLGLVDGGGLRGRVVELTAQTRIVFQERWVQDKTGSYLRKTATLYGREESRWVKQGAGTLAVAVDEGEN